MRRRRLAQSLAVVLFVDPFAVGHLSDYPYLVGPLQELLALFSVDNRLPAPAADDLVASHLAVPGKDSPLPDGHVYGSLDITCILQGEAHLDGMPGYRLDQLVF